MTSEPAKPVSSIAVRWAWAGALAACIVVASGQGQVAGPDIINFDKAAHFFVFGLLATLVARTAGRPRRRWLAVLWVALFAAGDELRQSLTPGRFMEFADWAADALGASAAVVSYQCWPAYRRLLERPLFRRKSAARSTPSAKPALAAERQPSS